MDTRQLVLLVVMAVSSIISKGTDLTCYCSNSRLCNGDEDVCDEGEVCFARVIESFDYTVASYEYACYRQFPFTPPGHDIETCLTSGILLEYSSQLCCNTSLCNRYLNPPIPPASANSTTTTQTTYNTDETPTTPVKGPSSPESELPLIAATFPPIWVLMLIATVTLIVLIVCIHRKRKRRDRPQEEVYYSVIGPTLMDEIKEHRLATMEVKLAIDSVVNNDTTCHTDQLTPYYETITVNWGTNATVDPEVQEVVARRVRKARDGRPNGNITGSVTTQNDQAHDASVDTTPQTSTTEENTAHDTWTSEQSNNDDVTTSVNAAYGTNIAIAPEVMTEENVAYDSGYNCGTLNPAYGTNIAVVESVLTEENVAYNCGTLDRSSSAQCDPAPVNDAAIATANLATVSNPAYGTNVSIAPQIETQINMAYEAQL